MTISGNWFGWNRARCNGKPNIVPSSPASNLNPKRLDLDGRQFPSQREAATFASTYMENHNARLDDLICFCGKSFTKPSGLSNHQRACKWPKTAMKDALGRGGSVWKAKKRKLAMVGPQTEGAREPEEEGSNVSQGISEVRSPAAKIPRISGADSGTTKNATSETVPQPHLTSLLNAVETPSIPSPSSGPLPSGTRITRSSIAAVPPAPYRDDQPTSLAPIPRRPPDEVVSTNLQRDSTTTSTSMMPPHEQLPEDEPFCTPPNLFGLYGKYDRKPNMSHLPNDDVSPEDLSDINAQSPSHPDPDSGSLRSGFWPYPNQSSFLISEWFWNGGQQKSKADFAQLIGILTDSHFSVDDIHSTSWDELDTNLGQSSGTAWVDGFNDAGWIRQDLTISVPFHRQMQSPGAKDFHVGPFYRRSIVSIIKERLTGANTRNFHFEPYELYWKPGDTQQEQRVYGELYNSMAFLEVHRELQKSPPEPGCTLQRVVVALMFASDETHLTQFGETKLWPLYLYFGNDSKYCRSKPSLSLCNHVAYFAKLPDNFKDFVCDNNAGKGPTPSLCAHCQRELLHAQWKILLDDEFMEAFVHGIVIKCCDGISRRFYPRVFTYSADYKEKAILSGIRNLGTHLCPRCLVTKAQVHRMGQVLDLRARITRPRVDNLSYRVKIASARGTIYKQNFAVNNSSVKELLNPFSLVPTENAFSAALSPYGFNVFSAMVVDLMHEVESGNWRSIFIHILRILNASDEKLVHEMDRRYRQIPTFGRDTIRKFRRNTSEMKNLAARDWEDMLQCAIPVFDGLLGQQTDKILLDLLFIYAEWHGLAKLRVHTEETLQLLQLFTSKLGDCVRKFKAATGKLNTRELPKEVNARMQRQTSANNKKGTKKSSSTNKQGSGNQKGTKSDPASSQPRKKELNLETYKFHAIGDYVEAIRRYGTTDSYSTETGELEHRTPKSRYSRTSKKDFVKQLTKIERRQARIKTMRQKLLMGSQSQPTSARLPHSIQLNESTDDTPTVQYVIGRGQNEPEHLQTFMHQHSADPATKDFLSKLKLHLLPRACIALGVPFSHKSANCGVSIFFQGDRMYKHRTIRFNYTTYDVRRDQDVVNPTKSQHNIMMLATQTPAAELHHHHHFLYAQVLGIYHVNVVCIPSGAGSMWTHKTLRMDFLWVRWYEHFPAKKPHRLDTLRFPAVYEEDAFGFVDPAHVLRACHVMPVFRKGQHDGNSRSTIVQDGTDWVEYYLGRFSDRDLLMRYHWGRGIGHTYAYAKREPRKLVADEESSEDEVEPTKEAATVQAGKDGQGDHTGGDSSGGEDDLEQNEDEDLGQDSSESEKDEDDSGSDHD